MGPRRGIRVGADPGTRRRRRAIPARYGDDEVAAGRIRNKANEKLPTPDGWLLDREGRPSNDPLVAKEKGGFLTSLGGSPENSSYKGYGLAATMNILASCLSGATLITTRRSSSAWRSDPTIFRCAGNFEADVATFLGALGATQPVDPALPVMVADDPQRTSVGDSRVSDRG